MYAEKRKEFGQRGWEKSPTSMVVVLLWWFRQRRSASKGLISSLIVGGALDSWYG